VAALRSNLSDFVLQIWDATTGGHPVTVTNPDSANSTFSLAAWSPSSQYIAVVTAQNLFIVNGQTGVIAHTFASSGLVVSDVPGATTGKAPLTDQLLASGGLGYRALSWSPDGRFIALAISEGPYGQIVVINSQTGSAQFTFTLGAPYNFGTLSWSSDGQYLAATAWNTSGAQNGLIAVWRTSNHQEIWHHTTISPDSSAPVVWQPQSHNLLFTDQVTETGGIYTQLQLWNVLTGKFVKQYGNTAGDILSWSSNGQEIAYLSGIKVGSNWKQALLILNAVTGQEVYAYFGHPPANIQAIAWSPDGHYMVTAEAVNSEFLPGSTPVVPPPGTVVTWLV
jgi:WD40 repeat protein